MQIILTHEGQNARCEQNLGMFVVQKCVISHLWCDTGLRAASCDLLEIFSQF